VLDGLAGGAREHGTIVRVTPDIVRDYGVDAAERTLEVARKFADEGGVGLNCAGGERTEIEPFAPVFRAAKDAGLRSVPHAGEWAGPENVWQTLEHLLPDRIGHGVRSIDEHPFLRLRGAGVVVTLNSDDPPMFGAWLDEVFEAARFSWNMSDEDLADVARTGVRSSFADEATKRDIERGIDDWLASP
jgi:adenosine deaminase